MPLEEDTEAYLLLRKTGLEEVEAFKLLNIIGKWHRKILLLDSSPRWMRKTG